jgi:hypothetical protein
LPVRQAIVRRMQLTISYNELNVQQRADWRRSRRTIEVSPVFNVLHCHPLIRDARSSSKHIPDDRQLDWCRCSFEELAWRWDWEARDDIKW